MSEIIPFFREAYTRLHPDRESYPWQESLFLRLIENDWPPSVTAPTGAGKTSLLTIWLAALAWQVEHPPVMVPRRLVWVVNRRVVVDQATEEAEQLRQRLQQCPDLATSLTKLCLAERGESPLAISTLRGEHADNREWVRDPSRAAIVVGTVDMIGSRLLFSGYGDSFRVRAHHAGLLGHDTLIVNDEAHLTPAFSRLLGEVERRACGVKPVRTIRLSATLNGHDERFPKSFDADLNASEAFIRRFHAPKWLSLHQATNPQDALRQCVRLASENPALRTIVFTTRPEDAAEIARQLRKIVGDEWVRVLTGTQRGHDRDKLTNQDPVFRDFRPKAASEAPCYLVATSAGEVGIDISCSRLITLIDTADHLLQRFGRLNRFGETTGEAHLVFVPPKDKATREIATLQYLRSLPPVEGFPGQFDVSVNSVFSHPPPDAAVSLDPAIAQLHDWIVDRWSLTSMKPAGKPDVEHWLHGQEDELAQTNVVWRSDVRWLANERIHLPDAAKALRIHPLLAREKLQEPTHKLLHRLKDTEFQTSLLLTPAGDVQLLDKWPSEKGLRYATLILPPGCGALEDGMFSASGPKANDVADIAANEEGLRRARFIAERHDGEPAIRPINSEDCERLESFDLAHIREYLNKKRGMMLTHIVEIPSPDEDADEPEALLVYAKEPKQTDTPEEVLLDKHQCDVGSFAGKFARCLGFDDSLRRAYEWAGHHHDLGKKHEVWRTAMNCQDGEPLAKTGKRRTRPKLMGGLRHELVSLADATRDLAGVPEEHRDLALHFIACHHGWARPHFKASACDPTQPESSGDLAYESTLRFARLQRRYGPWGLAYLEAVFRAADWLASEGVTPVPGEETDES